MSFYQFSFGHLENTKRNKNGQGFTTVTQVRGGYIKEDKIKHILPKIFYNHKLQQIKKVDVK